MTAGHTAIVTGANHGIGAATAQALAQRGCAVLCTFLRIEDQPDPGTPPAYRDNRAHDAGPVVASIQEDGGRALAVEADLADPATPAMLFDAAEAEFGPVDILVNNATGWLADTFAPSVTDRHGRSLQPVTAATWSQQFGVDAMAAALMISDRMGSCSRRTMSAIAPTSSTVIVDRQYDAEGGGCHASSGRRPGVRYGAAGARRSLAFS